MKQSNTASDIATGQPTSQPTHGRREITSAELLGNSREIRIRHADEVYTLRHTSKGKLILTK